MMHINGLWYNKALYQKQMKFLFYTNLLFGSFSIITIAVGFKFINDIGNDPEQASVLVCYNGNVWIENNFGGTLFMMCHQILILLQINGSQFVLIRIPDGLELFKPKTLYERIAAAIRFKLLNEKLNERVQEMETFVLKQKSSIGGGTGGSDNQKVNDADDDFFRIKANGEPVAGGQAVPLTEEE